jgi:Ca2+-binding RTX toxin-like protein
MTHHGNELFITDILNIRVVVFDVDGNWQRNFGSGTLGQPVAIDADSNGSIWITDPTHNNVSVWTTVGAPIGDFGSFGSAIGAMNTPTALTVDPSGKTVWVVDQGNNRVQVFTKVKCGGELLTHVGTSYSDKFSTGPGHDVVALGEGKDTVTTGGGNDIVCGGPGNDKINLGVGADTAIGHKGKDTINGGAGNDSLEGSQHRDTLNGGGGSDTLKGGSENDTLNGGSGPDTLLGGSHDDALNGNKGNDTLKGGAGNDTCKGGAGNDTASGCETETGIDLLDGRVSVYRSND